MKIMKWLTGIALTLLAFFPTVHAGTGRPAKPDLIGIPAALIIGNANYPTNRLRNAVNDANSMSEVLKEAGFTVTTLKDATSDQMKHEIERFTASLRGSQIGLIYFSGFGFLQDEDVSLLPVEVDKSKAQTNPKAVKLSWVLDCFQRSKRKQNIVILDTCLNDPFQKNNRNQIPPFRIKIPEGTLLALGTHFGGIASDGENAHGLYTQELLEVMRTPNLPIELLFKQVRARVATASKGTQIPFEFSSFESDFSFFTTESPR